MEWSAVPATVIPALLGAMGFMLLLWLVQLRTGNAGIVDFGWAAILGSLAVYYAVSGPGWIPRRILIAVLGGLWGYRLAGYLLRTRVWRQPEEGRYVTLRRDWASPLDLSFLAFFQAQALLAVILSVPFILAAFNSKSGWMGTDVLGAGLWLTGWIGETVADRQLSTWKQDPANRGKTCRAGLWAYSRHPNYFFEWIIWCGFGAMGLGTPGGWLGLSAPLLILYLIVKVTGIPPTEAQALKSRKDYRDYQQTTSPFFPWFNRKGAST